MQKTTWLLIGLLTAFNLSFSQTPPTPEAFLGYKLGDHYTHHYKIVNYFKAVAQAMPSQVKLEQYGETNEGRPLLLAYIASPENLSRLEIIRRNNLRLAGLAHDKLAPDEQMPVIVWLSYNVHGNEPSSSEAAMKMLYEMVNPANARAKDWLKNTVVIIDPCINPDGRDRYVNWFTVAVGKRPNLDPQSREHREPWPGGRTNHYNFDLNRDWAWQTQKETQQRMVQYNAWLPQVHVDFHEQGINNPYYFAPAAEPYHDVITPWQRDFQIQIGKNNAKYFDQQGWLFFTKEEFDLFYPSYGDTYPIYNGGIGMTFEQGGGPRGGLAVLKSDDDTLTLADRLEHHYTTGMSTVEMASLHAEKLIREFHQYFVDAQTKPGGEFKSYLIRADQYGDRLERLKKLLDKNNIQWIPAPAATMTGIDYETGKPVNFKSASGDIAINANQPKGNLLRVLFERQSRISDSVTYDITAWSIPYVYGLQAYGLNTYVTAGASAAPAAAMVAGTGDQYAYAVRWTGMHSVKFLLELLKKGVKTRFADNRFQAAGQSFEQGTLIVANAGNKDVPHLWTIVTDAAQKSGVSLVPVGSGFVEKGFDFGSDHVHVIHKPKVAFLTGEETSSLNAGEIWYFFEQELDYPVTQLNATDLGRFDMKDYDVLIIPNGYYRNLNDKHITEVLKNWVRQGGRLIVMENAVQIMSKSGDWGIHSKQTGGDKKDDEKAATRKEDEYMALHKYGTRQRDEIAGSVPGSIYRVELDNTHPLAFGYGERYYTLKQDDNVYEFIKEDGWNVGVIRKDNLVSGFTGVKAKEKLKDGAVFAVEDLGRGEVIYMADDPLFRNFWENGKLLFANAVFLVGQE